MSRFSFGKYSIAIVAQVSWACGGGDDSTSPDSRIEPTPTSIAVVSGDAQVGTVGQQLAAPIVVRVNDQLGNAMSGVGVTFAVSGGGGALGTASVTTDAGGQASTTWTLGTVAAPGNQVTATINGVSGRSATFSATAQADVPAVISLSSGNSQSAFRGTKLAEVIEVLVRDQFANPVSGVLVTFAITAGTGALDSTVSFTDVEGEARTGWTLSNTARKDTVQAQLTGVAGSPVVFSAEAHNLSITSVSPNPLVPGQPAVITGTGFSAVAVENVLTLDGTQVVVDVATDTRLDITVPNKCSPAGAVAVQVAAGGFTSAAASAQFQPQAFVTLAPGQQMIVTDPAEFCFQFNEAAGTETYLIGVQSTTEVVTSRTPVTVTATIPAGAMASAPVASLRSAPRPQVSLDPRSSKLVEAMRRHRAAEAQMLQRGIENYRPPQRSVFRAAGSTARIPGSLQVGDQVPIRVADDDFGSCGFTEITTTVRAVTARAVWLDDLANPSGGLTPADIQTFADQYENTLLDVGIANFGALSDLDGNGKVAVVITQEVNRRPGFVAGFVIISDYGTRANCAASNEGEIIYMLAGDSADIFGDGFTTDFARDFVPIVAAHETVHVLQLGRRAEAMRPDLQTIWELEGQATLGEELGGHAVLGNSVGQNLRLVINPQLSTFDPAARDWYFGIFIGLYDYYGFDFTGGVVSKVEGAPEDCTWLTRTPDHACVFPLVNSVPWSFLRWLSDQFGPNFAGGAGELQSALIDSDLFGFDNIEAVVGAPIETLLAQWAAMLYLDDRVLVDGTPAAADPVLTMPSWDLFNITSTIVVEEAQLIPRSVGFTNFSRDLNVRAGSTGYFLLRGGGRPATAIRATGAGEQLLPAAMQFWIVRLQ